MLRMELSEFKTLLSNAKEQITGAKSKRAINTMTENIEKKVLAGEQVELMLITHKKSGIVYLVCTAAAAERNKFVCVALNGNETKLYSKSTLMSMFSVQLQQFQQVQLNQ